MNKRWMAGLLTLFLLLCTMSAATAVTYPCEGVSNTLSVRVRKTASTQAKQVATLDKGESVTVLSEETKKNGDVWYQVETAKGKTGYVLSDYLSIPEVELIQTAQESPDATLMRLKIKAACRDANSVGNKWTQYYEWNGVTLVKGEAESFVAPEVELTLYARIREQDSKPDTAMEKVTYLPTTDDIVNGFVVTQTLRVTENAGRYKGNVAVWTVEYIFTPAEDSAIQTELTQPNP